MKRKRIMISFKEGGENGGPFVSHKRIMESNLNENYTFIPLIFPKGRIGLLNIKIIRKLVKDIKEINPDLIHFTGLQLEGFHIALAAKITGKKTVLAIHGSSCESLKHTKLQKIILNLLEIVTLKISHTAYGVSEYVSNWENIKKYSKRYFGTIYNLPNENYKKNHIKSSFKEEYKISEDEIVIVSTGRITEEKGFPILSNIIKKIKTSKKIVFLIVGDGNYKTFMQNELKKSSQRVIFLGYRNDIPRILSESHIFILPTLHETLCNSIIEAGKEGLAIISTNVGGIPEIIDNNYNGYLVEPNNINQLNEKLSILIENEEIRTIFSRRIKEKINSQFNKEKIIIKIDKMYRGILNNEK